MTDNHKELQQLPDSHLVCFCSKVSKGVIREAILSGASSVQNLQKETKAGIGNRCKELNPTGQCCHKDLKALIEIYGKLEHGTKGYSCCTKQETQK